ELQRALLRPETRASLDRDLRTVDVAIAELKDAVARDPNNPALRRLLASSYRQKIDLLKRVGNASCSSGARVGGLPCPRRSRRRIRRSILCRRTRACRPSNAAECGIQD